MKKLLAMISLLAVLLLAATALAECHHTYDMVDVKKVTCESDGYYLLKCNDCGHTVKEITDKATGHTWKYESNKPATCDEKGYNKYNCVTCGEVLYDRWDALGHDWKDSKVFAKLDEYMKENGTQGVVYIPYTEGVSSTVLRGVLDGAHK